MTLTARQLFALDPLGAYIKISDGTLCPPARHVRKVREWKGRNFSGYYVSTAPRTSQESWDRDRFTIQEANDRVLVINRIIAADDSRSYEIISPPKPGSILAYSPHSAVIEVRHVWADERAARDWATSERYDLGKCGYNYLTIAPDGSRQPIALSGNLTEGIAA